MEAEMHSISCWFCNGSGLRHDRQCSHCEGTGEEYPIEAMKTVSNSFLERSFPELDLKSSIECWLIDKDRSGNCTLRDVKGRSQEEVPVLNARTQRTGVLGTLCTFSDGSKIKNIFVAHG